VARRLVARRLALAGLAAVAGWAVAVAGAQEWAGLAWLEYLRDGVDDALPHNEAWMRVLSVGFRGGLVVALATAAVGAVLLARTRRWRELAAMGAVLVGAIGTVQAIKRGLVPFVPGVAEPQLSGQMPVVVAVAAAVVLLVPARWRRRALAWAVAAVVLAGAAVVVAWHTPAEVLSSTLLAVAWVLALAPVALRAEPDEAGVGGPS